MKTDTHLSRAHNWLAFHAANIRHYLAAWRSAASASPRSTAACEAAYGLLEHTAMLWRYTGDAEVRRGPLHWPLAQRRPLVTAACHHLQRCGYTARALQLCRIDALNDHDRDMAETLLLERDSMQSAFDFARDLLADVLRQERSARLLLADAISTLSEGDDALLQRPDIISVASRILEPLRALIKVTLDKNTYWWLYHARQLDAQFEQELASPAALARALGLPATVFSTPAQPAPAILTLPALQRDFTTAAAAVQAFCEPACLPAAAKSQHEQYSRVRMWSKSYGELRAVLRAQRPPQLIKAKTKTTASAQPYAAVVIAPRPLPEQPARAAAQWHVHAPRSAPRKDCAALVVNRATGALIGLARYTAASKDITLTEGHWTDFDPAHLHCADITLIVLTGK